jgi:hypothetical protein
MELSLAFPIDGTERALQRSLALLINVPNLTLVRIVTQGQALNDSSFARQTRNERH